MFSLKVVASIVARLIATVLTATIVGVVVWLVITPKGAFPYISFPAAFGLIISTVLSSFGIPVGDFIAPETGRRRYAVFVLGGAIAGAAFWLFVFPPVFLLMGALPGGAAGFVASLWRSWIR